MDAGQELLRPDREQGRRDAPRVAVMPKFYEIGGRFPAYREEVPQAAVDYLGSLGKVEPARLAKYSWRCPDDRVPQGADPQSLRDPAADRGR